MLAILLRSTIEELTAGVEEEDPLAEECLVVAIRRPGTSNTRVKAIICA
jgi:hypothetical protein